MNVAGLRTLLCVNGLGATSQGTQSRVGALTLTSSFRIHMYTRFCSGDFKSLHKLFGVGTWV